MLFSILKFASIDKILCYQFPFSLIDAMLQIPLIILSLLLNLKISRFLAHGKCSSKPRMFVKIDLNPMAVLKSSFKLSVVNLAIKVCNKSLIRIALSWSLSKINAILIFFNDGLIQLYS